MLKHKYIEHLQGLESIRNDTEIMSEIIELVNNLQLKLTEKLLQIMETKATETLTEVDNFIRNK